MSDASRVTRHATTCVLDCPDTCSLEVTVRGGVVEKIGAGPGNPVTSGFICSKVSRFGERVHHVDRLLRPMFRVGKKGDGAFEPASWDAAIERIAERLGAIRQAYGGEAILPYHYGGSNGFLTDELVDHAFFAGIGASRLAKTICAAPTGAVVGDMYGKMPGVAFPDYVEARFILIWGANPRVSNIHLVPYLKEAKRRGAFVALVDPVRTLSEELVDIHLPVYPGADLPLALGVIDYLSRTGGIDHDAVSRRASGLDGLLERAAEWPLERAASEARVDAAEVRRLADAYRERSPAVLRCGWGLERNRNGGDAVAAVLALPALLGKFGVRGGGYTLSNSGAGRLDASRLWDASSWTTRVVNMTELAAVLGGSNPSIDPPVKGLFVYNCNPVASVPDQNALIRGLEREDLFTVVFDQVRTDTAPYADVLLPATTFLEHHDLRRGYGSYYVGRSAPVIAPRGEARSNVAVFQALGRAMGLEAPIFRWPEEEIIARLVKSLELGGRPAPQALVEPEGSYAYDFGGAPPVQLDNVFPGTPEQRIDLLPKCLGETPYRYEAVASTEFPLALLTPSSSKMVNSTLGEFNLKELRLAIHPGDAAPRGIETGDRVRVFNGIGEVECLATVDGRLRPGVVHMPKGAWRKSSLNGRTSTALTPADVSHVGGGACFNDARVEVRKL